MAGLNDQYKHKANSIIQDIYLLLTGHTSASYNRQECNSRSYLRALLKLITYELPCQIR